MVIDSSDVSFSHLFPGSKTRTMQDKASYDVPISLDDADEADDYSRAMWAFDAVRDGALGELIFPPHTISFDQQVELDLSGLQKNLNIKGYGAVLETTEPGISALLLSGQSNPQQALVEGLTINHKDNTSARAGIELLGTTNVRLFKNTVIANNTDADWAAVLMDEAAENYWTVIDQLVVRKYDGGDEGRPSAGVRSVGGNNATLIINSAFNNCVDGVLLQPHSTTHAVANAFQIANSWFENCIDACHADLHALSELAGFQFIHCRLEDIAGHGLNLTGSTTQTMETILPLYGPNFATGMSSTLSNPNNLKIVDLTGLGGIGNFQLLSRGTPLIRNYMGAGFGLELWAADAWQMLKLSSDAGAEIGGVHPNSVGGVKLHATNDRTLDIITTRGISQTGTPANNLRGTVTLASGTATVSFATAEANTSYFIALSGNANETFRWGSKTTGGFTISSSNGSSTAAVDWHLIR